MSRIIKYSYLLWACFIEREMEWEEYVLYDTTDIYDIICEPVVADTAVTSSRLRQYSATMAVNEESSMIICHNNREK